MCLPSPRCTVRPVNTATATAINYHESVLAIQPHNALDQTTLTVASMMNKSSNPMLLTIRTRTYMRMHTSSTATIAKVRSIPKTAGPRF